MKETLQKYEESLYYELEMSAKYIKRMGQNYFNSLDLEISPEEYISLDIINEEPEICQRDLAKLMLKDRAGTGRVLQSLELKGYIERYTDTKGNRIVRKMNLTQDGEQILLSIKEKLLPMTERIQNQISYEEYSEFKRILKKIRTIVAENIKTNI